jgi:predicted restriction endonuclease
VRVHFTVDKNRDAIDVTNFPWFQKLLQQQQSFRNGFNSLSDKNIIHSLELLPRILTGKAKEYSENNIQRENLFSDLESIKRGTKNKTTKKAMIDARLGQGQFRADVSRRWNNRCAVTGCGLSAVLRASHIKRWSECNNRERLDPSNGFLLAAHIDALFDKGLVSFSNSGRMLLSDQIDVTERKLFRLPKPLLRRPTRTEIKFLDHHRRFQFSQAE